jgi:hypothetical protein
MPLAVGNTDGAFNGVTDITMLASPAAATQRMVKCITIHNRDTATVTVNVRKVVSGTPRIIFRTTLDVGDTLIFDDEVTLDSNGSIHGFLALAPATTNPDYTITYGDIT